MRTIKVYQLENCESFQQKLLWWAQQFEEIVWLDSNSSHNIASQKHSSFDALFAADALTSIQTDYQGAFEKLNDYQSTTADWIFGYLSYDLKNATEALSSKNSDGLKFHDLIFFQPKKLLLFKNNAVEFRYLNFVAEEIEKDFEEISNFETSDEVKGNTLTLQAKVSKESYVSKIEKMLAYIQRGDIYEANFCQEFFSENATINPLQTYLSLNAISNPPYAAFLKWQNHYLLSASPERYIQKCGNKVISQPIKGTARRSDNPVEDKELAIGLQTNEKERSENIMITDLVRNDLSRTAQKNSVSVEELCELYTFKQVHQLISTITSEVAENCTPTEILKTTFPMGSMTGAPKISAMKIIEELEETKRGLFSGAVGYFTPEGDFDFNVVIRSILYNKKLSFVSFSVGSAITAKSLPEAEYEECLIKAKAMRQVLETV